MKTLNSRRIVFFVVGILAAIMVILTTRVFGMGQ